MDSKLKALDPGAFLQLARQCGLQLRQVDLMQMTKRELVAPRKNGRGESCYSALHLYVVARYLESVEPICHPWERREPDNDLEEIRQLARDINTIIDAAVDGGAVAGSDEKMVARRFRQLRHFLGAIDPFGPLQSVVELLDAGVVDRMKNSGRLYLEVQSAMQWAAQRLESGGDSVEDSRTPKTRQMYDLDADGADDSEQLRATTVIGEDDSQEQPEERTRRAIDEVVSAADEASEASDDDTDETERDDEPVLEQEQTRPMQVIQVRLEEDQGLDEESSDPIVLVDDEDGEVHMEEQEPDDEDGDGGPQAATDDSLPDGPPPSPMERRAEFEKRRKELAGAKDWEALVQLFEEDHQLFEDTDRHQEILLELARIYEVKLRDRSRAFDTFDRAWSVADNRQGRSDAFEEIQRLGKSSGFHNRYLTWLEGCLENDLDVEERIRLHKELARGLYADQQFDSAFDSYAAFLKEAPNRHITAETLNQLRLLGEHVDQKRLNRFYTTVRKAELKPKIRELVDQFTPAAAR